MVEINVTIETQLNGNKGEWHTVHLANLIWEDWLKLVGDDTVKEK